MRQQLMKPIPQERVQNNTVEQIVDVPVSQIQEETVEVIQLLPQDRMSDRVVEPIVDSPSSTDSVADSSHGELEQIIAMPVMVQRQVQKTVEVPQIPFIDEAVDVPVIVQRQVPIVQRVQKTVEASQAQSTDKVMNALVIMQRQVPAIQVAQKTVKELRSTFEVGHTNEVHAWNQPDKNRWRKKQGV